MLTTLRHALPLSIGLLVLIVAVPASRTAAQSPEAATALLALENLPQGWILAPEQSAPSDRGIEDPCMREPPVQPLSMARVEFQREDQAATVTEAVGVFQPGDAERVLGYIRAQTESCGAPPPADTRVSPLSLPALGDDSVAVRIETGDGVRAVEAQLVAVRRGNAFFLLVHNSNPGTGPVDTALTEALALLANERLGTVAGE